MKSIAQKSLSCTTIRFLCRDILEIVDSMPAPNTRSFISSRAGMALYAFSYDINGTFKTKKSIDFLNDFIARMFITHQSIVETLSYEAKESDRVHNNNHELKDLARCLKSLETKQIHINHNYRDRVFLALKIFVETKIKDQGESREVAYSILESFAFSNFVDHVKDKSTLRAKCRSVWEWYNDRGWKLTRITKKEYTMTRQQASEKARAVLELKTRQKVQNAVQLLTFMQKKINAHSVALEAKCTRATAKKYLQELNLV